MTATPRSAKEKLQRFVPLVDFFGEALGPSTEIVLHDPTVPDKSIVAIANGHISGRKIGGPVTNLALMFMKQGDRELAAWADQGHDPRPAGKPEG